MNWYILDEVGNIINLVAWDGVSSVDFGGKPISEEDYKKMHPDLFPEDDAILNNS